LVRARNAEWLSIRVTCAGPKSGMVWPKGIE